MKDPVGLSWVSHSTLIYTLELILCSHICVYSATRHNIHMYRFSLTSTDKLCRLALYVKVSASLGIFHPSSGLISPIGVTSHGGRLAYERGGMLVGNSELKPLKETDLDVVQASFDF